MCTTHQPRCGKCYHEKDVYISDEENKKSSFSSDKFPKLISLSVQTENKVASQSIGLQADICDVSFFFLFLSKFKFAFNFC